MEATAAKKRTQELPEARVALAADGETLEAAGQAGARGRPVVARGELIKFKAKAKDKDKDKEKAAGAGEAGAVLANQLAGQANHQNQTNQENRKNPANPANQPNQANRANQPNPIRGAPLAAEVPNTAKAMATVVKGVKGVKEDGAKEVKVVKGELGVKEELGAKGALRAMMWSIIAWN